MTSDITNDDTELVLTESHIVVVVSSYLDRRLTKAGHVQRFSADIRLRQHNHLNFPGALQILPPAFFLDRVVDMYGNVLTQFGGQDAEYSPGDIRYRPTRAESADGPTSVI